MSLVSLIIAIALVGVVLYLINKFVPMEATVKNILNVVVIVALILFILAAFGILGDIRAVKVPRV